jgi:hypothetical protein
MEDPPPLEPPPVIPVMPPKTRLYTVEVWRRCNDAEAVILDGLLATQSLRQRRLWSDAPYILITDTLYPLLLAGMTTAVDATRAAQILAPNG